MGKRILINGLVILGAATAGICMSMKPWHVYRQQNADSTQRVEEMRIAEKHRDQLLRAEARVQSSIGREELARQAGYLGPGEVASNPDKK